MKKQINFEEIKHNNVKILIGKKRTNPKNENNSSSSSSSSHSYKTSESSQSSENLEPERLTLSKIYKRGKK